MVPSLVAKGSALEAWKAIKERRIGNDSVQKVKAQRLRKELETMKFKPGESVDDFTERLENLVAALETLGEVVTTRRTVEKLLRAAPKALKQTAVAIEITSNLDTLSLEDACGRLRAAEEGLPVLRATPTGISAVVNARGEVVKSLPWRQAGVIDAVLPPAADGPPPFARFGNVIPLTLAFLLIIGGIVLGRRRR